MAVFRDEIVIETRVGIKKIGRVAGRDRGVYGSGVTVIRNIAIIEFHLNFRENLIKSLRQGFHVFRFESAVARRHHYGKSRFRVFVNVQIDFIIIRLRFVDLRSAPCKKRE